MGIENENMRINMGNKELNLTRCADAVRNTRDKMRLICAENKELKKANRHRMDKTERKQGNEEKTNDERKRKTENNRKESLDNIAALGEQKIEEKSKMNKELREENEKLKSNISCMQSDIADKNSKIVQLTIANVKLAT